MGSKSNRPIAGGPPRCGRGLLGTGLNFLFRMYPSKVSYRKPRLGPEPIQGSAATAPKPDKLRRVEATSKASHLERPGSARHPEDLSDKPRFGGALLRLNRRAWPGSPERRRYLQPFRRKRVIAPIAGRARFKRWSGQQLCYGRLHPKHPVR